MTPRELLDEAKKRFPVMYLAEPIQEDCLRDALGLYQRIAGPFKGLSTEGVATEIIKPGDFHAIAICIDADGRWHKAMETDTAIQVCVTSKSRAPFTIYYFVNLAEINIEDDQIPSDCIPLLRRYLNVLLEIPNTARAREVMLTTNMQIELPSEDDLQNKKIAIEEEIEESQAILPMATVF